MWTFGPHCGPLVHNLGGGDMVSEPFVSISGLVVDGYMTIRPLLSLPDVSILASFNSFLPLINLLALDHPLFCLTLACLGY